MIALVGYNNASASCYNKNLAITPPDAWNIDTKLDDGFAGSGKVVSTVYTGCVTSTTPSLAQYKMNVDTKNCGIGKIIGN